MPYLSATYPSSFLATFAAFTVADQALTRQVIESIASVCGLTVFEVPAGQGDLRFGKYDLRQAPGTLSAAAGFASYPNGPLSASFAPDNLTSGDVFIHAPSINPVLLTHEIAHAVGLKHPYDGDVQLERALQVPAQTIFAGGVPGKTGPGAMDVQALQYIYGGPASDGTQVASWSWDADAFRLSQTGGAGDDTILGVSAQDAIQGGDGADILLGLSGDDTIVGGAGADRIYGSYGADVLDGGAGDDTLDAGDGFNVVRGGDGNDAITLGQAGVVDGGAGVDRLTFGIFGQTPLLLDFNAMVLAGAVVDVESVSIRGGSANDTIVGSAFAENIFGNLGDDHITPGGGADTIFGGGGVDTVDFSTETAGVRVSINFSRPVGPGFEFLGGDVENVIGTGFADTLGGDSNSNQIYGRGDSDSISGGTGDNYLRGDEGDDTVQGGAAFDDINGNMGNDSAAGGEGNDWVVGGKDDDVLLGQGGDDLVYGNLGNDTLEGGAGADIVRGGQGDDVIAGGDGADFMAGDRGADTVTGGAGADTFHTAVGAGLDQVLDFSAADGDRILLPTGTAYILRQAGSDTVVDLGGEDQMVLVGVAMASITAGTIGFI